MSMTTLRVEPEMLDNRDYETTWIELPKETNWIEVDPWSILRNALENLPEEVNEELVRKLDQLYEEVKIRLESTKE